MVNWTMTGCSQDLHCRQSRSSSAHRSAVICLAPCVSASPLCITWSLQATPPRPKVREGVIGRSGGVAVVDPPSSVSRCSMLVADTPVKPATMSLAVSLDPVLQAEAVIRALDERWFQPRSGRSWLVQLQDYAKQRIVKKSTEEAQVNSCHRCCLTLNHL